MNRIVLGALTAAVLCTASAGARAEESRMAARWEKMCAVDAQKDADRAARQDKAASRVAERLTLTDAQKGLYKEFQAARLKARADTKTLLCGQKPDTATLAGKLAYRERQAEQRLVVMKATNPKLLAFYNSLDAAQKAKFDAFGERRRDRNRDHRRENDD
ncbi:MAG: Spy/CpxP family protein refolding chaperone [Hyphomicrobiales bacterium]|nr:Spy/CpxP family protein refolding chaperone [Hyphomicrobiales bacterium]